MTDYVISGGRIPSYPSNHFGGHFATATRATFCLPADLIAGLDTNTLAIPGLPITVLSNSPVKVGETFLGMHVQKRVNDGLAGVTAKIVRSHDLANGKGMWKTIQPTADTWDFADIDAWVDTHHSAGRELVFVLFGTPTWASARPTEQGSYGTGALGAQAEPADMSTWSTFCTTIATRYLGKIQYYEIWNEPNYNNDGTGVTAAGTSSKVFFFSGTWAVLSQMTRLANQAIKAVDPLAKIICPPVQGWTATSGTSDTYFTSMMAASDGATGTMAQWVDIIGVHLYLPSPNKVQDLAGVIDRVNACKTTAGVSALETWDTESAPISPDISTLTNDQAKLIIGRSMITMAAKGISRTIYYQYDHATMGFINRPQIQEYRERIATLLRSGRMTNAHRFTDGRVAYATESGLTII